MISFNTNIIPKIKGAYIVGGSLRDILANRIPSDYDFAVLENPKNFAIQIAKKTNSHVTTLRKQGFTIYRVSSDRGIFDVSRINGRSIEEDLAKRDFTINAMAVEVNTGETIDPHNGLNDLENKKIRMVSETAFLDDPIRLLRAYRLGAIFGFSIEKNTESTVKKNHSLIALSAGEQIHAELIKIFKTKESYTYLEKLFKNGLLFNIIPEIESLRDCKPNLSLDIYEHTLKAYKHLEWSLNNHINSVQATSESILRIKENACLLKYAILLHDIGKPRTCEKNNNTQFCGHEKKGAEITETICNRLKFSSYEKNYVSFIVRNHLEPLLILRNFKNGPPTQEAKTKFFAKCENTVPDLTLHATADIMAENHKPGNINISQLNKNAKNLISDYYEIFLPVHMKKPVFPGKNLINEFKLSQHTFFQKTPHNIDKSSPSELISLKTDNPELVRPILDISNNNSSS